MVLSDTSIKRPVFATVVSLLLVVLGLAAYIKLPVREYPAIDPPIISVTTVYKGASNEVVESQVTELVEAAVAGIEGVKAITSTSREERSNVTIEFQINRNIDAASNDVRDRVARIMSRLPETIETPVIAKVDSDQRAILWITLYSDRRSALELTDIAARQVKDRLSIVPGVASVFISGERKYAMRVWMDRKALAARGLTVDDVEQAIKKQNVELPSGRLESSSREFTVKTDSRLKTPEQFASIIVANRGGYQVRLGEVAKVELGAEDERNEIRVNGRSAVGLGILRQSTANTLSVADGAKAEMKLILPTLPSDIETVVGYDESLFIKQSIYEVFHALGIGVVLVIGVIFMFLRSVRATIIPAVAIPVSLIASFTVLSALGFSINVLTLLALVLAIGIVVDDAIVVLENIHRRIEEGEPPLLAAVRGARQISFAVIATTLVLVSVFVPISFMEGNTGRLFSEFGIALAASVLFSGLVALTLSPMMCSKLLKPHNDEAWLYRTTEAVFRGMNAVYHWLLSRALRMPLVVVAVGVVVSGLAYNLWLVLPKEFAPVEDRGVVVIPVTTPEGSSIAYTRSQVIEIERVLKPVAERGDVNVIMANIAPSWQRPAPVNQANVFIRLKAWDERTTKQQAITREVMPGLVAIPGARAFAVNPPSLGQRGFQPPIQFVIAGTDYDTLRDWRDKLMARMNRDSRFINVDSNYKENKPELRVSIDRSRAADLGVPINQIGLTLEAMFGNRDISTFIDRGEEYKVMIRARAEDRATSNDLNNIFVRAASGSLIPLSSLVTLREVAGPQELNRFDRLRSITISATLTPDYPLGQALADLEQIAKDELPGEVRIGYQGQSREFKESTTSLYITFGLALLIVFLVLAAQFESWIHPLVIMLSVPLAVTGGLFGLWLGGISLNVYSQIGMILLIGIMAKNGILIVEFANQLRDQGRSIHDAVLEASVVRLRPILMTSISTIVGAVPLAWAHGAGAESREAIGIVIIGGVAVSTVMTSFIVPALYLLLAGFTKPVGYVAQRLAALEKAPASGHAAAAE